MSTTAAKAPKSKKFVENIANFVSFENAAKKVKTNNAAPQLEFTTVSSSQVVLLYSELLQIAAPNLRVLLDMD
jgi:hypothetical protein